MMIVVLSTAQIVANGLADSSNMTEHNHDPHSSRALFAPNERNAASNHEAHMSTPEFDPEEQIYSRESEQSICTPEFDDFPSAQ